MSRAAIEDGTGIVRTDGYLTPFTGALKARYNRYRHAVANLDWQGGLFGQISQGHYFFGFNRGELWNKPGVWYREWAPAALQLRLIGDFNGWDRMANPMVRDSFGVWSLFLPDEAFGHSLVHGSKVKVMVVTETGGTMDRIPAYIKRVVVAEGTNHDYVGVYWNPPPFEWKNAFPKSNGEGLRIYEAHVGMASEEYRVASFDEFRHGVLPRIKNLGYNAVQLMAVQEHPYYGSFGYHVSNFFAVSSRFGTPEQLKELIDAAHGMGIRVVMDLVHSHAVKNTAEGLNYFDGTPYQYFHDGPRGDHPGWDSKLFDYAKYEVQRFLLSNVRYWLEEFHFDGFRFDGVTSMLYRDHGLGSGFNSYHDYFGGNIDDDAVTYLQMANTVAHGVRENVITIAEDVSGMVGIAAPVKDGGIGFDYRLSMGIPDHWIKLLKHEKDENWNLNGIYHMLLNRRRSEKHIAYAESHDQSLVGDKTIAFWLMDKEMYWSMAKDQPNLAVDRGIALHKMIRLITFSLGGEGYLNFIGNEFGHPEWVDFPREGNGNSFHHARRQWSLVDNGFLKYQYLNNFDRAMQRLDIEHHLLEDKLIEQLACHEDTRQLVYRHGPLVFVFNFHPTESFNGLRIPVPDVADYKIILNTDNREFGGHGLIDERMTYPWQHVPMYGRNQTIQIYLPARCALVLMPD